MQFQMNFVLVVEFIVMHAVCLCSLLVQLLLDTMSLYPVSIHCFNCAIMLPFGLRFLKVVRVFPEEEFLHI